MRFLLRFFDRSPETMADMLARHEHAADAAATKREAIKAVRRARRMAARLRLPEREAPLAYREGLFYRETGRTRTAENRLARAARLWRDLGDQGACGDAELARAGAALMSRDLAAARSFAEAAETCYRAAGLLSQRPQLGRLRHAIDRMGRRPAGRAPGARP